MPLNCLTDINAYKNWECKSNDGVTWCNIYSTPVWDPEIQYRRKPTMILIGNSKVPTAVTHTLEYNTWYWGPSVYDGGVSHHLRVGDELDNTFLDSGLIHLSEDAARQHSVALLSYNKACQNA